MCVGINFTNVEINVYVGGRGVRKRENAMVYSLP